MITSGICKKIRIKIETYCKHWTIEPMSHIINYISAPTEAEDCNLTWIIFKFEC